MMNRESQMKDTPKDRFSSVHNGNHDPETGALVNSVVHTRAGKHVPAEKKERTAATAPVLTAKSGDSTQSAPGTFHNKKETTPPPYQTGTPGPVTARSGDKGISNKSPLSDPHEGDDGRAGRKDYLDKKDMKSSKPWKHH